VVQALFGAVQPMVWVSDMLGSQRGHGIDWQVCLAHLLRDARYAVECGDTAFSAAFKRLLLRAIAIGRRRDTLKDTTLKQYHADLDRRLDRIMAAVPIGEPGRKLRKRIAANRAHLFVFVTNRCVPYTNNASERNLRPSVIFRKVTNGFRCEWGAETYAAFRSVVSTAKANRASVLAVLQFVLAARLPQQLLADAGWAQTISAWVRGSTSASRSTLSSPRIRARSSPKVSQSRCAVAGPTPENSGRPARNPTMCLPLGRGFSLERAGQGLRALLAGRYRPWGRRSRRIGGVDDAAHSSRSAARPA